MQPYTETWIISPHPLPMHRRTFKHGMLCVTEHPKTCTLPHVQANASLQSSRQCAHFVYQCPPDLVLSPATMPSHRFCRMQCHSKRAALTEPAMGSRGTHCGSSSSIKRFAACADALDDVRMGSKPRKVACNPAHQRNQNRSSIGVPRQTARSGPKSSHTQSGSRTPLIHSLDPNPLIHFTWHQGRRNHVTPPP